MGKKVKGIIEFILAEAVLGVVTLGMALLLLEIGG